MLVGNAVGLIVASLVFSGFDIDVTGFIVSLILFTVAVRSPHAVSRERNAAGPLELRCCGWGRAHLDVPRAARHGPPHGRALDQRRRNLDRATVVVWLASLLAVFILPFFGCRKYLDERRA